MMRRAFCALAIAGLLASAPAYATNSGVVEQGQPGELVVFPLFVGSVSGDLATNIVVQNVDFSKGYQLRMFVIDADGWGITDLPPCPITAAETTQILAAPSAGGEPTLHYECSEANATPFDGQDNKNSQRVVPLSNFSGLGLLVVTVWKSAPNPLEPIANANVLVGDFVLADFVTTSAFSAPGIPFQKGSRANMDEVFVLDGGDVAAFPEVLSTTFISPTAADFPILPGVPLVDGFLVLFGLDGSDGFGPRVLLDLIGFDDDESFISLPDPLFDCMAIFSLREDLGITEERIQSSVGSLTLVPLPVKQDLASAHDDLFGNGDGTRQPGAHGWFFQQIFPTGKIVKRNWDLEGNELPVNGEAGPGAGAMRFGRTLQQALTLSPDEPSVFAPTGAFQTLQ